MLTTYEHEVETNLLELEYLLNNADKLSDETKGAVRKQCILFMIELHEYLKENDFKAYEEMIDYISKEWRIDCYVIGFNWLWI